MADGASALACNSTWQIRTDTWCSLEEASAQLVLAGAQHRCPAPTEERMLITSAESPAKPRARK